MIPEVSLVIPCHNEEGNLQALADDIRETMARLGISYEVVITDDCSSDRSWAVLKTIASADTRFRVQRFERNCGESVASWAGMQAARAPLIITIDADGQNSPADIPRFLDALRNSDCVCGTRVAARSDGDSLGKVISSLIANWIRNRLSSENISDSGCTYRAFRRECIAKIRPFNGMHRFLGTLIRMEGYKVSEIPVRSCPRTSGRTHYGVWNRALPSFVDLLAVRWMKERAIRYRIVDVQN